MRHRASRGQVLQEWCPTPFMLLIVLGGCAATLSGCDRFGAAPEGHVDRMPPLVAEEEARIGDLHDPDVGFSQPAGVDVDPDGHVHVVEGSVPEIRVYDADGSVIRRIGRRGGGPGEFEGTPGFGVVGDTVWTWDAMIDRLTLFDRQGRVLGTSRVEGVRVPVPGGHGYVLPHRMLSDGTFSSRMSRLSYLRPDDPPTGVRPTDRIPVPIVRFDPSGAVVDTVGWADRPPPRMWRPPSEEGPPLEFIQIGERRLTVPNPPTTLPQWQWLPDGYLQIATPLPASADEGLIGLTRFGPAGDTVWHRDVHYRPSAYTSADLDSVAARAVVGAPGGGVPYSPTEGPAPPPPNLDALVRALRGAMDFPEFQLPLQYSWLGNDNSLWLRWIDGGEPTATWIVVDPDGTVRGRLELPSGLRLLWARGDTLWARVPGEFEVPWLVRYRIGPAF